MTGPNSSRTDPRCATSAAAGRTSTKDAGSKCSVRLARATDRMTDAARSAWPETSRYLAVGETIILRHPPSFLW